MSYLVSPSFSSYRDSISQDSTKTISSSYSVVSSSTYIPFSAPTPSEFIFGRSSRWSVYLSADVPGTNYRLPPWFWSAEGRVLWFDVIRAGWGGLSQGYLFFFGGRLCPACCWLFVAFFIVSGLIANPGDSWRMPEFYRWVAWWNRWSWNVEEFLSENIFSQIYSKRKTYQKQP